jgi:Thioredoxin like C-terminal domain
MPKKTFTPEQIVAKLRQIEVLVSQGKRCRWPAKKAASPIRLTPETYAGYERTERFASRERLAHDSRRIYSPPVGLSLNQWGLGGSWNVSAERSALQEPPGRVVFRFHSRDLHMVLGKAKNSAPIRFKVTLDGIVLGENHGVDSSADGSGEVREPRTYQLVRQKWRAQDRTFEIEFWIPGSRSFHLRSASRRRQIWHRQAPRPPP